MSDSDQRVDDATLKIVAVLRAFIEEQVKDGVPIEEAKHAAVRVLAEANYKVDSEQN